MPPAETLPLPAAVPRWPHPDARRFALSLAPAGAAAALQLAVFAITARALGPEAFGLVAVVYGVSVIATEITGLGGDSALVRAVALDREAFPRAWGHALALAGLSWPPLVLLATGLAASLTAPALAIPTVAALVAGETLVGRTVAACELAMVAHGDALRASLVRLLAAAARAVLVILVFGTTDAGVPGWALATLLQSALLSVALLAWVRRLYGAPRLSVAPDELRFGLLLMLNHLSRALAGNLDRVVLSALLPPAALGLYAAASRLQLLGGILNQAATRLFQPRFFPAAAAGGPALASLTRAVAGRMASIGLVALALTAAAAQALPLLLGPGYAEAGRVAAILALASPFIALQYPPADALTAQGRQALRTTIYAAGALASAGLAATAAGAAGVSGAALAVVAGQAGLCAALWTAYRAGGRAR